MNFSRPAAWGCPVLAALAGLWLAGCAVGPNFEPPKPPTVSEYTAQPTTTTVTTTNVAGGEAQRFAKGAEIAGDWWTLFHSAPLNALIEQALTNNPDLKAAQAALTVARENMLAQRGGYYPSVSAGFSATRQKTPGTLAPIPNNNAQLFNLFTPQVTVSYVPDVFGQNRRTVESIQAQEQAVRYQMIATYTTLAANVVVTAIQEGAVQMQIDATRRLINLNSNMVEIVRYQMSKGYAGRLELAAQESQLAQTEAALPPLLKQLAQQRDLLAALSGGFPDEDLPEQFELSDLQLPQELPISLPSQLVEQRPDVRQAEENMHAASAQIGIATANRLPNFTLTADAGTMALTAGKILSGGAGF